MKKILLAFIFIGLSWGCASDDQIRLYGAMEPREFNEVKKNLDELGISYSIKNGNEIYLSRKSSNEYQKKLKNL